MSIIIDGTKIAQDIRRSVQEETLAFTEKTGVVRRLAVVLAGDDPASKVYVGRKAKACAEAGFLSREYKLPADVGEAELLALIRDLNNDRQIHGILVQLPLPKHIAADKIIAAIDPNKDVDGFHPANVGRLVTGSPLFVPCTPRGHHGADRPHRHQPFRKRRSRDRAQQHCRQAHGASAFSPECHGDDVPFRSKDLPVVARRADVMIAAIGKPHDHRGHGQRGSGGD